MAARASNKASPEGTAVAVCEPGPAVVILAAGHGKRMGGPKLFRRHGARTFAERILARCRESRSPVTLVVDSIFLREAERELRRIGAPPGLVIAESRGEAPMLESVRAALDVSRDAEQGFWLWPVDAPFLSARGWASARETVRAFPAEVWKLRSEGKTGHPIWFPGWSLAQIRAGIWPDGLLGFLAQHAQRVSVLVLEGEVIGDFNSPEALAAVPESL